MVVKSSFVFNASAPTFTPFPMFDVVLGVADVPTRNRITFGCSGDPEWHRQRVLGEGDIYPATPEPGALIGRIRRPVHVVGDAIKMVAIIAIQRAMTEMATGSPKRVSTPRPGHPWRKRNTPHARKTLFEGLIELPSEEITG